MRESDFHAHLAANASRFPPLVRLGPGDDCAVLDRPGDELQLITTDQLISGRHYDPTATPVHLIARKAIARSISDIAAMAGEPMAFVCTACLSDADAESAACLYDALAHWADYFACPLVGGDYATGPHTVLTTTVLGTAPRQAPGPILRSGARDGDLVWVTGRIGASLETGHHLTFEPRIQAARELRRLLGQQFHAAIDISDGLGRDAARVGFASNVNLSLQASEIPLRVATRSVMESIADGEDYELLFCTAPGVKLPSQLEDGTPIHCLGSVEAVGERAPGASMTLGDGTTVDLHERGWDHHSSEVNPP